MIDPERLKLSNATKLERRMLEAAGAERPSLELTNRMRQAVGLSASGVGATALAATKGTGLAWISAGIVAAAIVGGAVGVWSSSRHAGATAVARPAAPVQCAVSSPASSPEPTTLASSAGTPLGARHAHVSQHRGRVAVAAPAEPARADLRGEIALVDEARTALRDQLPKRALALLRRYSTTYPEGTFGPEVEALRVEALDGSGQHRLAQSLAREFVVRHPESPLAERVGRSIDGRP
jgi:hypothetical protein